ncbi:hypothetical protein GIB67_009479 [Kingdonia uniflora]|uniref:Uncharacterized protein n=1 Tax=Kingdonia uniflora TaxID=39325 RepID=A0A7J7N3J1_9MAGN|nr:hypothetical protein GIB67_009479 [Kingdonia uniflora]
MIMFPAQNLFGHDSYGGWGESYSGKVEFMSLIGGGGYDHYCREGAFIGSDHLVVGSMAEDESMHSRTSSVNEVDSSSKGVQEDRDERWLQLGIGSYTSTDAVEVKVDTPTRRGELVELSLLPGGSAQDLKPLVPLLPFQIPELRAPPRAVSSSTNSTNDFNISTNLFLQHQRAANLSYSQPHEVTWGYRPNLWNPTMASSSSSVNPMGSLYYQRPFPHQNIRTPRPSFDMRIINPPRRPRSGIWFVLQASQTQSKEPFLPQIPKSYMRIKDGRMTVRLLMKYLVNKLSLSCESEVEVTCRGQQLLPLLTLQHVRDNIWSASRDAVTLPPDYSSTAADHVMILHYGRTE